MPRNITLEKLIRIEEMIIKEYELHQGDPEEPVVVTPLLEGHLVEYSAVRRGPEALTSRWREYDNDFVATWFNAKLQQPASSAWLRYAMTHEFLHPFLDHMGSGFLLYRDWRKSGRIRTRLRRDASETERLMEDFERHIDLCQEQECAYAASFVLVRVDALRLMADCPGELIARKLDVPEFLVGRRWELWERFGK